MVAGFDAFTKHTGAAQNNEQGNNTIFHKTKLCKFDAIGACTKGAACTFAHGSTQVRPMPDFTCTKMCPRMSEYGYCDDMECRFAHEKTEIRRRNRKAKAQAAWLGDRCTSIVLSPAVLAHGNTSGSTRRQEPEQADDKVQLELDAVALGSTNWPYRQTSSKSDAWCTASEAGDSASTTNTSGLWGLTDEQETESCHSGSSTGKTEQTEETRVLFYKTKMCKFNAKGVCNKGANCKFAHAQDELRPSPGNTPQARDSQPIAMGITQSWQPQQVHPQLHLVVKNTFYTVESEESFAGERLQRSSSVPRHLA